MQKITPGIKRRYLSIGQLMIVMTSIGFISTGFANEAGSGLSGEQLEMAKQKAQSCATCHGEDGIAVMDIAPNLAGQQSIYTATQLKAYRSGDRQHEIMNITAKMLSDEDIQLLSDYYQALGNQANDPDKPEC